MKRLTNRAAPHEGMPCGEPGCLSHVTHPCEGCGRIAGRFLPAPGGPVQQIAPATRGLRLIPPRAGDDPYERPSALGTGKEGVYRFTATGGIEAVPEEEQIERPRKKKPAKRYRKGMGR